MKPNLFSLIFSLLLSGYSNLALSQERSTVHVIKNNSTHTLDVVYEGFWDEETTYGATLETGDCYTLDDKQNQNWYAAHIQEKAGIFSEGRKLRSLIYQDLEDSSFGNYHVIKNIENEDITAGIPPMEISFLGISFPMQVTFPERLVTVESQPEDNIECPSPENSSI